MKELILKLKYKISKDWNNIKYFSLDDSDSEVSDAQCAQTGDEPSTDTTESLSKTMEIDSKLLIGKIILLLDAVKYWLIRPQLLRS